MKKLLIALVVPFVLIMAFFARGGTTEIDKSFGEFLRCDDGKWLNTVYYSGDVNECPDIIEYAVRPAYISEESSELVLRVIPLPVGVYGLALSNSGVVYSPYAIDIDTANFSRIINDKYGIAKGVSARAKMSTDNTLFYYPFDRYSGAIDFQATDLLSKRVIPSTISIFEESLSGWKLAFSQPLVAKGTTGNKAVYDAKATLEWSLARANIVYFSVLLLLVLLLIALASAMAITRSISRGNRPPSMNLLLWLATILFANLQVRVNFPGNPPIGILLDYIVVFPVLSALLVLGIVNTFYWLRRWDWDLENTATS